MVGHGYDLHASIDNAIDGGKASVQARRQSVNEHLPLLLRKLERRFQNFLRVQYASSVARPGGTVERHSVGPTRLPRRRWTLASSRPEVCVRPLAGLVGQRKAEAVMSGAKSSKLCRRGCGLSGASATRRQMLMWKPEPKVPSPERETSSQPCIPLL